MMLERHRAGEQAGRAFGAQAFQHRAVAHMDAVENADRQEKIGIGVIRVEIPDDLHVRLRLRFCDSPACAVAGGRRDEHARRRYARAAVALFVIADADAAARAHDQDLAS